MVAAVLIRAFVFFRQCIYVYTISCCVACVVLGLVLPPVCELDSFHFNLLSSGVLKGKVMCFIYLCISRVTSRFGCSLVLVNSELTYKSKEFSSL
ncbi:hypothetical protein B0T26DRAFT_683244, partial [Lasiosphaeria miniovina]